MLEGLLAWLGLGDARERRLAQALSERGLEAEATIIESSEDTDRGDRLFAGAFQFADRQGRIITCPFKDRRDGDTGASTASGTPLHVLYAVGARLRIRYLPEDPALNDFDPVLADLARVRGDDPPAR